LTVSDTNIVFDLIFIFILPAPAILINSQLPVRILHIINHQIWFPEVLILLSSSGFGLKEFRYLNGKQGRKMKYS
jgi:hypothetical protein